MDPYFHKKSYMETQKWKPWLQLGKKCPEFSFRNIHLPASNPVKNLELQRTQFEN